MATREQMLSALRQAHDEGDDERADELRRRIRALPAEEFANVKPGFSATAPSLDPSATVATAPDLSRQPAGVTPVGGAALPAQTGPNPFGPPRDISPKLDIQGNFADKLIGGFGTPLASAGQNLKQSFPETISKIGDVTNAVLPNALTRKFAGWATPTTDADIQANRDVASTGPGMVGNLAGNAAMIYAGGKALSAIPGVAAIPGAAAKVAQMFPKTTGLLAAPAAAAATNVALDPVKSDEYRPWEMTKAAAFPLALKAGGRAVTGLVEPTVDAAKALAKKIVPTVGQGGQGGLARVADFVEKWASESFAGGKTIEKMRDRAGLEAVHEAANRVMPTKPGTKVDADWFKSADTAIKAEAANLVQQYKPNMTIAEQRAFDAAKKALHERESNLRVMESAASGKTMGTTGLSLEQLEATANREAKKAGPTVAAQERGLMQDLTAPTARVLEQTRIDAKDPIESGLKRWGRKILINALPALASGGAGVVFGAPAALATAALTTGAGLPTASRSGARFLFGDYGWQKKAAELLKKYGPELQAGAAAVGGTQSQRD